MMKYTFQEGALSLFPAAWQDTSVTFLRDEESGLSVVVSRSDIPEGSNAEKEFHRQWDVLRTQMGEINQSDFQCVTAGADDTIPAIEVDTTFERNGQRIWQRQLAVQVPDKPMLLIFTLSALRPFTDEDGERWNALKRTLTLNSTRNV